MNNKMDRDELIKNLKDNMPDDEQLEKIEKMAEEFKDKSNDEIFVEIIKINKNLEESLSEEKYDQIFKQLEEIRPMLSDEQNAKLNMVLRVLKK